MDRLAKYRQIVRTFLMEYSKTKPSMGDLKFRYYLTPNMTIIK